MDREALTQFVEALRKTDHSDDTAFQRVIVEGMDLFRLLDKDLAREFGVSRPTITRWRNGANAPHPALRKHVYSSLQTRALSLLRRMEEEQPVVRRTVAVREPSYAMPMARAARGR